MSENDDVILKIKSYPISSVISKYLKLTKVSSVRFKANCPFHKEKTPSFYIDDSKGFYKCFGCGEGGDIINFVEKIQSISFQDAVNYLCNAFNIINNRQVQKTDAQQEKNKSLYAIMQDVSGMFHENLFKNQDALDYLTKIRNLSNDTIRDFKIGYATNKTNEDLMNYAKNNDIELKALYDLGLLRNVNNYNISFFNNRVMIPILNIKGNAVGFGGRIIGSHDEKTPKYINSSESVIFKKRESLFNFKNALNNLKNNGHFIIVEGYFDVIALHQHCIKTGIAALGTSITDEQLQLVVRYDKSPVFIFDSDNAGKRAALRAAEMLLKIIKVGIVPRFLTITDAKDIDELLQTKKIDVWKMINENCVEVQSLLFNEEVKKYNIQNPNQKAMLEVRLEEIASSVQDKVLSRNYRQFFKNSIYEIISRKRGKGASITPTQETQTRDIIEKKLLAYVLQNPDAVLNDVILEEIFPNLKNNNQKTYQDVINNSLTDNLRDELLKYAINKIDNEAEMLNGLVTSWKILKLQESRDGKNDMLIRSEIKKLLEKNKQ